MSAAGAVQRPPMPLPVLEEPVHEEGSCDLLNHIVIATVAAVAFAFIATTAVASLVLSGFMFSILLPVEGVIYLVIGVAALVLAAVALERVVSHSVDACELGCPSSDSDSVEEPVI